MRIVVISDSHGASDSLRKVVSRNIGFCDFFIHLGDGERDVDSVRSDFPQADIRFVRGNCDYESNAPGTLVIPACDGIKIFCTHGNRYHVHSSPMQICYAAEEQGCRIALFGHTHCRFTAESGGIYLMNPGSLSLPRDGMPPSFGCIDIKDGNIVLSVSDLV